MEHSKRFNEFQKAYEKGEIRKEQILEFSMLGIITTAEYQEITGESYTA